MSEPVLTVSHLSKKYARGLRQSLWYGVRDITAELLPGRRHGGALRAGEFWALDDVSFALSRGESLAIVGANGAGKSTLLKVLHGLQKPDRGEVRFSGTCEALIELGTGFNPSLTGRENLALGAALHGVPRADRGALVERAIEFTELGDAIDSPMQGYSTGMKARLAFALAAHMEPDVLLVDEVLAVGDIAFQRKCVSHMRAYLDRGGALLFVSHNTYQIQATCQRGIFLDRGRVRFSGTAVDTIGAMFEAKHDAEAQRAPRSVLSSSKPVEIVDAFIEPMEGETVQANAPVRITVRYRAESRLEVVWGFSIWTADQWVCVTGEHDMRTRVIEPGDGELTCVIRRLPLFAGRYSLRAGITDAALFQPLALFGWTDAGAVVDVQASATLATNAQISMGQLVKVDVDFD